MKKPFKTAIAVSLIILSLAAGVQFVEMAKANWLILPQSPNTDTPIITVTSPTSK